MVYIILTMDDEHIYKSHNKSLLLYHLVFPAKYRRKVFSESVENTLKDVCVGISERYEIRFIEIGVDEDHVHSSRGFDTPLLAASPYRECFCVRLGNEPCTIGRNTA